MRTIPQQESLTVEFKSDQSRLNDRDLVATVVCLANTDGGVLYLGVEDEDTITGTHPQRQSPAALSALPFLKMIIEEENRTQSPISLDALIVLSRLRNTRRIDVATVAQAIQKPEAQARAILERLVEIGLIEAHGIKKGRTYTLSAETYRDLGESTSYIRQTGFDSIQQEQMVLQCVQNSGKITRKDVMDLLPTKSRSSQSSFTSASHRRQTHSARQK